MVKLIYKSHTQEFLNVRLEISKAFYISLQMFTSNRTFENMIYFYKNPYYDRHYRIRQTISYIYE